MTEKAGSRAEIPGPPPGCATISGYRVWPPIGSGTVILGAAGLYILMLICFGELAGWERAWRVFGVAALKLPFGDMHHVTDHAACMVKGFDAYFINSCDPLGKELNYIRDPFNYPPVWLWLGYAGIRSEDATWMSALITIAAFAVLVALLRGRSRYVGALASLAILSPSVMLGVERGNTDLIILALIGSAALLVGDKPSRISPAFILLGVAVVLKLYPVFCIAVAARFSKRTAMLSAGLIVLTFIYLGIISEYLLLLKTNTPSLYFLSYGYKVPFLGIDELLTVVGRRSTNLAETWLPIIAAILTLGLAGGSALYVFKHRVSDWTVADNASGMAFLFGAGIYCGTFMLGANFDYRLMFLLLCLPHVLDLLSRSSSSRELFAIGLLITILAVLWLNAFPFAEKPQLGELQILIPQLLDWGLFFALTMVMCVNLLHNLKRRKIETAHI